MFVRYVWGPLLLNESFIKLFSILKVDSTNENELFDYLRNDHNERDPNLRALV